MGLIKQRGLLKQIEWLDDSKNTLVYRFPMEGRKITMGSKLTVRESQVAVFVNKGVVADVFTPGIHTLSTSNLPILSTLQAWAYGFKSPFTAEVYFVNTKQFPSQKWGTSNPITMRDKDFGSIRVRGFGSYSFRVNDAFTFMKELFGTNSSFETEDITSYLKSLIVTGISETIAESGISALDLSANLSEFSSNAKTTINEKFKELGLKLVRLNVENISFPEEVEKAIDASSGVGIMGNRMDSYVKYQAAQAMREAAQNENGGMATMGMGMGAGMAMGQMLNQSVAGANAPSKFCTNCGNQLPGDAKFCPHCGKKVK